MALTRGIKNCRICGKFKGCSPHQLSCRLTGNRPQSATFHTPSRCASFEKTHSQTISELRLNEHSL